MRPGKWLKGMGCIPLRWHAIVGASSAVALVLLGFASRIFRALMDHYGLVPVTQRGVPLCSRWPRHGELPQCESLREYRGYAGAIMTALMLVAVAGLVFLIVAGAVRVKWGARLSSGVETRRYAVRAPGYRFHRLAEFLYCRRTMERVFDPMLADMLDEYLEALANGRLWKARWIRFRYYLDLGRVVGLKSIVDVVKEVVGLWKVFK